jgi:hypothetical protein
MPISYTFDHQKHQIHTTVTGELTLESTIDYFTRLAQDPECPDSAIEIVNFTDVTDFRIRFTQMENIVTGYQEPKGRYNILATIFYCPSDLSYGIARMLEVHHSLVNMEHIVMLARTPSELEELIQSLRSK